MNKRFSPALLSFTIYLCLPLDGWTQETPAPATNAPRIPLAQTLLQLRQIDDGLIKKIDSLCAIIDSEALAKRVSDPVAQSLRWNLRNLPIASDGEIRTSLGLSHLPLENGLIMDGIRSLETEWGVKLQQRNDLILAAADEARLRLTEVAHAADKAGDIDPLLAEVDQLQDNIQRHHTNVPGRSPVTSLLLYPYFLRALRFVIVLDPHADAFAVDSALMNFQNTGGQLRDTIEPGDIRRRIEQSLARFKKGVEDAQQVIDDALRDNKPFAVLIPAMAHLEEAVKANTDSRESLYLGANPPTPADRESFLDLYHNLILVGGAIQDGDFTRARAGLNNLQGSNLKQLGANRAASYSILFTRWQKILDEHHEPPKGQGDEFARQFAAIKTPADLEAFAAILLEAEANQRHERAIGSFQNLGMPLKSIAAAWKSGNPEFLMRAWSSVFGGGPAPVDFSELRGRTERDVLASALGVPELSQPPLSELAPEKAFDQFGEQLAAKGDWRKLLLLTETRGLNRYDGPAPKAVELAQALRAFLAAQNFELAELWTDAAQSYKVVLQCTDPRAPIRPAADRLKALNRSHPEGLSSPVLHDIPPR